MQKILILLPFLFLKLLAQDNFLKPDFFTKEGYCVVKNPQQRYIGLTRFNTAKEFENYCNGKMIFLYENDYCKTFTMEQMKFNIFISDGISKYKFNIGERRKVCSNKIIESLN